ncbi:MAG: LysM peptidoglycan-binding domain-containing protein [Synechococcus sp. SB0668_bin_15]|nr:LysM peptidoglycan-binding domain-containing protein [Synechococcus sp. SB0668_bin_15]MYC49541.1 LysM peptidoglycan-binding domain-containing protein [Synechococcus sp. SB0662_bin_14]
MARSPRLLAAIPLLSLMVMPALASGRYQVQPREGFYGIARKCQVDVHELMRLNPRPGNALQLGDQLRLPGNARCGSNVNPTGAVAGTLTYQVQPREGFYGIARKCQVDVEELMRLNSASGTNLRPGQRLTLPSHARCPDPSATVASTGAPRSANTPTTTTPTQARPGGTLSYQVQPREGFYSISRKCKVDTAELISLNPESPSVLRPGQRLTLPGHARCPDPSAAVASANTGTIPAQTTAGAKAYYEVQPRQSFYSIARQCQVNAKALMALNPRPGNVLHTGDQLELPGGAKCESVLAANPTTAGAASAASAAGSGATAGSGWRSYGPLKVNWQDWQMIEGHWVAQSLNDSEQPLYLAVNCPAQRINQTNGNGKWSTWELPDPGFEEQLMDDLCQEKKALS